MISRGKVSFVNGINMIRSSPLPDFSILNLAALLILNQSTISLPVAIHPSSAWISFMSFA
jgi:hypothetical protein